MDPTDRVVIEHLDRALGALLAARVSLDTLHMELPDEALDAALVADQGHQIARAEFAVALNGLMDLLPIEAHQQALHLEEAANALAASSASVGWGLGQLVTRQKG